MTGILAGAALVIASPFVGHFATTPSLASIMVGLLGVGVALVCIAVALNAHWRSLQARENQRMLRFARISTPLDLSRLRGDGRHVPDAPDQEEA